MNISFPAHTRTYKHTNTTDQLGTRARSHWFADTYTHTSYTHTHRHTNTQTQIHRHTSTQSYIHPITQSHRLTHKQTSLTSSFPSLEHTDTDPQRGEKRGVVIYSQSTRYSGVTNSLLNTYLVTKIGLQRDYYKDSVTKRG